jgi:hypothetical protein
MPLTVKARLTPVALLSGIVAGIAPSTGKVTALIE